MMRVKVFSALTENGIEKKVNSFLEENPGIKIHDMKFSASEYGCFVMLILEY